MSAERLREAARVLRERAEFVDKAEVAPGPWVLEDDNLNEFTSVIDVNGWRVTEGPDQFFRPVAAYIATMHPGVGLALADWLDDEAGRSEMAEDDGTDARIFEPAERIADLILGDAP